MRACEYAMALGVIAGLTLAGSARAQEARAVTLAEVLQAAVAANGDLVRSGYLRDQAEAQVKVARGVFDPQYTAELGVVPTRRTRTSQAGFPLEFEESSFALDQSLGGTTATGTSYGATLGYGRQASSTRRWFEQGPPSEELYDQYQASLGLTLAQELLRGARTSYNLQNVTRARNDLTAAELALQKQRQDTLYAAAEAYWNWTYAVQSHAIAVEAEEVAEEALRVGAAQVERGQLAPVEGTLLEAALVQARQDVIDANNAAEQAANLLLTLIGEDPSDPVTPATPPGDVPELELDQSRVVEVALAQNLDLMLARQQVDAAQQDLASARHGVLPSLTAVGSAGLASQRCPPGTADAGCQVGDGVDALTGLADPDSFPFVTVGGVFSARLGNRAARGSRDLMSVAVLQRERDLADLERSIAALVEEQVRALESAGARVDLADANLRLAEQTLVAEEALAAAGRSIQKTVLEARTEVSRTRNEAARARTDYRLAHARLLALQGQLTEQAP